MDIMEWVGAIKPRVVTFVNDAVEFSAQLDPDTRFMLIGGTAIVFLLGLLMALRGGRRGGGGVDGWDRTSAALGRLEKIDSNVNELRTQSMRAIESFRGDIGYLKQELAEIRKLLGGGTSSGGSPGGGGEGVGRPGGGDYNLAPQEVPQSLQIELAQAEPSAVGAPEATLVAPAAELPESLSRKLTKTRSGFFNRLKSLLALKPSVDERLFEELEASLIESDLGVKTSLALMTRLRAEVAAGSVVDEEAIKSLLKFMILAVLEKDAPTREIAPRRQDEGPMVVMVVGVNGVGKTTTVAKLAHRWVNQGAKVMVVAADTFRAAAVEQLSEWGKRVGVPVVVGEPDAKPGTVVFDGMVQAKSANVDVVIIDTAGRLHNKSNLMQELEGIRNVIAKHQPLAPHETILVLDGCTGQNALSQAREFNDAAPLTGVIITKLDGTPKGGIVVAIKDEFNIPIRYIGVGESQHDLRPFVAKDFVDALFDPSDLEATPVDSAHGEVRRRRRRDGTESMVSL